MVGLLIEPHLTTPSSCSCHPSVLCSTTIWLVLAGMCTVYNLNRASYSHATYFYKLMHVVWATFGLTQVPDTLASSSEVLDRIREMVGETTWRFVVNYHIVYLSVIYFSWRIWRERAVNMQPVRSLILSTEHLHIKVHCYCQSYTGRLAWVVICSARTKFVCVVFMVWLHWVSDKGQNVLFPSICSQLLSPRSKGTHSKLFVLYW